MKKHAVLSLLIIVILFGAQLHVRMADAITVASGIVKLEPNIIKGVEKDIAKISIYKHGEIRSITLQQIRNLPWFEDTDVEAIDLEVRKPELEESIAIEAEDFDSGLVRPHPVILKNINILPQHPLAGPDRIRVYPIPLTLEQTDQELGEEILSYATTSSILPVPAPTIETICFQLQRDMKLLRLVVHMKDSNMAHVSYIRVRVHELPCCELTEDRFNILNSRIMFLEKSFTEQLAKLHEKLERIQEYCEEKYSSLSEEIKGIWQAIRGYHSKPTRTSNTTKDIQ